MAKCYACANMHVMANMYLDLNAIPSFMCVVLWLSGSYDVSVHTLYLNGSYLSDDNYFISVGVVTESHLKYHDDLAIGVMFWQNSRKMSHRL